MKKQKIVLSLLGWLFFFSLAIGQQTESPQPLKSKTPTLEDYQSWRTSLQARMAIADADEQKVLQKKLKSIDDLEAKLRADEESIRLSNQEDSNLEIDVEAKRDREITQQLLDYAKATDAQKSRKQLARASVPTKMKLHYSQNVSNKGSDRANRTTSLESRKEMIQRKIDRATSDEDQLRYQTALDKLNNQ